MRIFLTLVLFVFFSLAAHAQDTLHFTKSEIIYGRKEGMALTMIMLAPAENSNGKAIISVVSGNWVSSYANSDRFVNRAKIYVNRGYTVFVVIHSSQPRYTIPDEIADLKRAVRFIRYNAKGYHVDGDHIGITGSSSGGHLSLMVGLSDDKVDTASKDPVDRISSRVQAVAVFYPPTDFFNWGKQDATFADARPLLTMAGIIGAFDFKEWSDSAKLYTPITDRNKYRQVLKEISPINAVSSDDPPVLIIHGDKDITVPLQQSQTIIQKLNDAHVPNQLIIKNGGAHGWKDQQVEEKNFVDWFDKYLK